MKHVAVIDIGKTNAKLALVEAENLTEVAVVTRPNRPLPGPPWPHADIQGLWQFFTAHLASFHAEFGIDAISVTTHGAAAVLLDDTGSLAVPMLDYEHPGPEDAYAEYDKIRPDFHETGSPRLPMGLNLGAQLHWMLKTFPGLAERVAHIVTYPQYWGWRLTGVLACDMSSLGCHTDLWDPWHGRFSPLVERLGLARKMAPPRRATEVLGGLCPSVSAHTGIPTGTPVAVGIHDSNASLFSHVQGREPPFAVVSTGTWVVAMAVGGDAVGMDPARDMLVNVNALGQPVPSARFMGGREYELISCGSTACPTEEERRRVLLGKTMILPPVEPGSGPFQKGEMAWRGRVESEREKIAALSYYLALMTDTCLTLIGARGPTIIEGPFARNTDFLDMLAVLRGDGVEIARNATGTSVGAALLCMSSAEPPVSRGWALPDQAEDMASYASAWRQEVAMRGQRRASSA
ncbi:FGGY-family carbohydrate kinase [Paracoccus sp. MBLB3053]|uniref:FGGY-family carbohydrate kinase n=1 Tax=Paracoccus aurantius TaxID=3073814 RepID=A0ABU2HXE0_9RHOB|nr:FGGY-family carbohydrate kinase [Paracoccus sp. MBLB3053]MDS9468979.1 FGGY-family carbohydrate kinase [Paracoccus sp. MBLB3053]